jgi:hypothetical protein
MKARCLIVVSAAWTVKAGRCSRADMQYRKPGNDLRQVAALNEKRMGRAGKAFVVDWKDACELLRLSPEQ